MPGRWESVTTGSGLRLLGMVVLVAFEVGMDAPTFHSYLKRILRLEQRLDQRSGDVVILDNLKPHRDRGA
jgi:hypothetical protein